MSLVGLLVHILIIALLVGLIFWVVQQMKVPEPFNMVVRVIVGIIAILLLLGLLTGSIGGIPGLRIN